VAGEGVVTGVVTRSGWAVAISLSGLGTAPRFEARREIDLVPASLPAQPYHAAAGLELAAAEELIRQVEQQAEDAAAAGLRAVAGGRPAGTAVVGVTVVGVAVVVKAVSLPGSVAGVLRSHAWMHAAEGVLYRDAVLAAARRNGWPAHAVEEPMLPAAGQVLAALGAAAGRPWRRYEKDAARAAITLLPRSPSGP
jgi:hypothetical protein